MRLEQIQSLFALTLIDDIFQMNDWVDPLHNYEGRVLILALPITFYIIQATNFRISVLIFNCQNSLINTYLIY